MRPISVRLPADGELREIREQLRAFGPDSGSTALAAIDVRLDGVSTELRRLAAETPFSELRATLPGLCEKRPEEIAALLDLCLEDEEEIPHLYNLIEYIVTLLSTEWFAGERQARPDPFNATPRLRRICEAMTDCDPAVIENHLDALNKGILELAQAESVEPIIQRIRQCKERVGGLMFFPELLHKIVEYNVTVSNRLDDELEAERTMHVLEAGIAETLADAEDANDGEAVLLEDETSWVDPDTFEIQAREEMVINDIADSLRRRLSGQPSEGPAAEVAGALDVSGLSHWENQAFLAEQGEAEAGLLRRVVVIGLVVRHRHVVEPEFALMGVDPDRFTKIWVPQLDALMQKQITARISASDYQPAKQLAQSRTRYLHPLIEGRRVTPEEREKKEAERRTQPSRRRFGRSSVQDRRGKRTKARAGAQPRTRSQRWIRRIAAVAAVAAVVGAGLGVRSVAVQGGSGKPMPTNQVRAISPYLAAAVIHEGAQGPSFVATVGNEWEGKDHAFHTEETIRIGNLLKQRHVHEVALFDERYRMVAFFERGWLIYPTPSRR